MTKPVIAIPADIRHFEKADWHAVQAQYIDAAVKVADVIPLIVPALTEGHDVDAVLDRVDGLLVSGSATNVHPSLYGQEASEADGPFDPARDATVLPLIRKALDRAIPMLAICRGIQELNVALGGTLASEIQERPGIWDHRKPPVESRDEMYAIRQPVHVRDGSCIAQHLGVSGEIQVNSLHRQALSQTAPRLQVEATAADGTIEAVSVIDAKAFAVGVQWHPEYWAQTDTPSRALFEAFGEAVRAYAAGRR
ncbi:gamma-glutamyl-gamma-aminobutyrate hydrolase family protein [Rhizobium sp. SSA_523]|uniref:gamma-glutamyl-gamma-aminobutyrate hydrolase family protein n=1 Tax=Rhizobium sp. SSA_523 TaxID=2952477 RepID=UPI00209105FF|nr:gamma-glutamyl-gamma-aminobutyrate hydrolase family protein [Rhizobium sp. SSA_523]MCO5731843.1 gamma-glutamyl-gamma-aminobutyrate hydrolase family protein [Rhizobium sp. SSA_523]WKC22793.1 gamma-glutamyl-gamma-aminobutyrate hydrolase family protein [Rhizobium sp. SSA_523]